METLTLMKMTKATALFGGFLIVLIAIVVVFMFLIWQLLKSNVSAKERESVNVKKLEAGDWLLGIVKFSGLIICPIVFCGIVYFANGVFEVFYRFLGFRNIQEIFELFVLSMLGLFFVGFVIFASFQCIKDMAKESAVK